MRNITYRKVINLVVLSLIIFLTIPGCSGDQKKNTFGKRYKALGWMAHMAGDPDRAFKDVATAAWLDPKPPRLKEIRYGGVFIDEAPFDGERKADGMTPNYAQGHRLSVDRWIVLYDTVDRFGFDVWRAIFYQIRADAPDGKVLRNGIIAAPVPVGEPVNGVQIFRHCGQPAVFGVPRGAKIKGNVPDHANIFTATWQEMPVMEYGKLVDRANSSRLKNQGWTDEQIAAMRPNMTRERQIMHFKLNNAGDDIEILSSPKPLRQVGEPEARTSGWAQPIPDNANATRWLEAVEYRGAFATIGYTFDPNTREYRWTTTSKTTPPPTSRSGEPTLVKLGDRDYVYLIRGFNANGNSFWYRAADPFEPLGNPTSRPDTYGQRYAWLCPDGVLRLFMNRQRGNPYGDRRNPLYCWDVRPEDFVYSNRRVVTDIRKEGMDIKVPFVDHPHLFSCLDGRQVITHRAIAARQVARTAKSPTMTAADWTKGGIHYAVITYEGNAKTDWEF